MLKLIDTLHPLQTTNRRMLKRSRPGVRFAEVSSTSSESSYELSPEDIQNMWYQHAELEHFQFHASNVVAGVATEIDETRGFERYTDECSDNQLLARKCIMLAIHQGLKEDEVASIARRCGEWSQEQAVMHALKDFYEVYCLPESNNKRAIEFPEDGRRVRARFC